MNRSKFFLTMFAAMLIAVGAVADTRRAGDISVSINPGFSGSSGHGSRQVDFVVTNRASVPRTVKLINSAVRSNSYQPSLNEIIIVAKVPANSGIKIPVFTPCVVIPDSRLSLVVDDAIRKLDPPLQERLNYYSPYTRGNSVLLVRGAILPKVIKSGGHNQNQWLLNTCGVPESEWSSYPQAYSRFDLIAITDDSLDEMSEPIKKALLRYAELGGILFIQGSGKAFEIPTPWGKSSKKIRKMTVWNVGYGRVAIAPRDNKKLESSWQELKDICNPVRNRLCEASAQNAYNINQRFPIIEKMQISPLVLLVILIIFTIIIGPVNILYLTKKKKKLMLLITIPVISIIFTIAVFVYSYTAEGWHARSRYDTMTLLDQQNGRATSYGYFGFYCPIPPYSGLMFSKETILDFQAPQRANNSLSVDWTKGQRLSGGFVKPKVPARFFFRKNESRRERVQVKRISTKRILVTNGIGTDLRDFTIVMGDNSLFQIKEIKAGAAVEAVVVTKSKFTRNLGDLRRRLAGMDLSLPHAMRGLYYARMERSPFVEPGIDGSTHKENSSIIGILSEQEAAQ